MLGEGEGGGCGVRELRGRVCNIGIMRDAALVGEGGFSGCTVGHPLPLGTL